MITGILIGIAISAAVVEWRTGVFYDIVKYKQWKTDSNSEKEDNKEV